MIAAPLLRLRALPAFLPRSSFRGSGTLVVASALIGPAWDVVLVPTPGVSVTLGRALILLAAAMLLVEWRRAPRPLPPIPRAVGLLIGGLAALWLWIVVNVNVWGCRCAGDLAGFSELIALSALAAVVATVEPRVRSATIIAVVVGATLAAALTLAGVDGLTAGTTAWADTASRLAGPYGNPNMLAFALAPALPAGLAAWWLSGLRCRLALAAALALVGVVLVLTFSRAGLLAALVGTGVVLVARHPGGSRAQRRTIAALALLIVSAALIYPAFAEWRRSANATQLERDLRGRDDSGWDAGVQGLIGGGPAMLANPASDVLEVRTSGAQQGVSRPIGPVRADDVVDLSFEARSLAEQTRLSFGLEDNLLGNGPAHASAALAKGWRTFRLRWEPTAASPDARLYAWTRTAGKGFRLRDVTTEVQRPGAPPSKVTHPAQLQGPALARLDEEQRANESRDARSRRLGVQLSLEAFASQPLRGIGWGRFPAYSTAHSEFEDLPTHNEYLRFLAELGVLGILLLTFAGGVVVVALWRGPRDVSTLAVAGMLATGATGLVFVNGLIAPGAAFAIALAAALACAASRTTRRPPTASEAP